MELHRKMMHDAQAQGNPARLVRTGHLLAWGAAGGLVGGLGLGVVMMIAGVEAANDPTMVLAAMGVGLFGLSTGTMAAVAVGLGIHLLASVLIGVVLTGLLVGIARSSDRFSRTLFPVSPGKGISTGLLGGLLVFLVFGLPMMFLALVPALQTVMAAQMGMPVAMVTAKLNGMMGGLVTAFFFGHLLYGLLFGLLVWIGVRVQLHPSGMTASVRAARTA